MTTTEATDWIEYKGYRVVFSATRVWIECEGKYVCSAVSIRAACADIDRTPSGWFSV